MSAIADLVTRLIASGTPPEVAAVVVAEAFAAGAAASVSGGIPVDRAAARRREYDRNRKAAKRNSTGNSTGIPVDTDSAISFLDKSQSQKEVRKEESETPKRVHRTTGHRLPDDWQPSEQHFIQATALGLDRPAVLAMAQDMRLWAKANEHRAVARKSDWNLTFSGWMRREAPKHRGRGPPGNSFASLHLDLQNAHGGYHDSPGLGEFDAPGFDLDIKPNSGG